MYDSVVPVRKTSCDVKVNWLSLQSIALRNLKQPGFREVVIRDNTGTILVVFNACLASLGGSTDRLVDVINTEFGLS